jgi:hypothetical protein
MEKDLGDAIAAGSLPRVKLLVQGGASIAGTSVDLSALNLAAGFGEVLIVEWLLAEGGANISDVYSGGCIALLTAAKQYLTNENVETVQWLLEHAWRVRYH